MRWQRRLHSPHLFYVVCISFAAQRELRPHTRKTLCASVVGNAFTFGLQNDVIDGQILIKWRIGKGRRIGSQTSADGVTVD